MVPVSTLLDPKARDPQLRAFAYLQARFVTGARNAVDCLLPLVVYSIAQYAGQQFVVSTIARFIRENYQLTLPIYMLDEMVPKLIADGALQKSSLSDVLLCSKPPKLAASLGQIDLSVQAITGVEQALSEYAKLQNSPDPLASSSWGDALISFFQGQVEGRPPKPKTVNGKLISDTRYFDDSVVGGFVLHASRALPDIYGTIEKIYYGVLVSDFLTKLERAGKKADYRGFQVIYDTTVLLRLLGTSGREMRSAALEMHQTLQDLGCQTFYFRHTYTELLNVLDYIVKSEQSHTPLIEETRAALDKAEITISQIAMIFATLDAKLGTMGITEHPETYQAAGKNSFQIDEKGFEEELKRTGKGAYQRGAEIYDAMSLALIVRLRQGAWFNDLARCKAVFVTHNGLIAGKAKRYLADAKMQPPRSIGAILTVGQMTTVAWLANEIVYEPQRISKELIANSYKASLPMDGWNAAFWEACKSETSAEDATKALQSAVYVHSAREIALRETRGHVSLMESLNMKQVLERAQKRTEQLQTEAHEEGIKQGKVAAAHAYSSMTEARASEVAHRIAVVVKWVVFAGSVAGIIIFSLGDLIENTTVKWSAWTVSAVLGTLSAADLLKLNIGVRPFAWLERKTLRTIVRIQQLLGVG